MYKKLKLVIYKWTPIFVSCALAVALLFYFRGNSFISNEILKYTIIIFSIPLWWGIIKSILNRHFGVDIIAGLALLVSVLLGQYITGTIILLMLSGGEALEVYALNRARKALSSLLTLMPEKAHIKTADGVKDVASSEVGVGMIIVVKSGEVIPADGVVVYGQSFVNESIMTGEAKQVMKEKDSPVLAGTTNTDSVLEIKVLKPLSESRLEGILSMVKKAEEGKAPFVRLADRYSVYFTIITIIMAFLAWVFSGDIIRVFAVLVIATPCPLILATPIAFMSGMSLASKKGIIVKDGGAIESLSRVKTLVFDKTGTVTFGVSEIDSVKSLSHLTEDEVLHLSASLDQLSTHILARSLLNSAKNKKIKLSYPDLFKEIFGSGVSGKINGKNHIFGKLNFLESFNISISENIKKVYSQSKESGIIPVYLADDKEILGVVFFKDEVRPEAKSLLLNLKNYGIRDIILLSGDKENVAHQVANDLGISKYKADCLPDEKLLYIKDIQSKNNGLVCMIGDGVNDAPALAQSDIGIALGTHGATVASDSADMVIISGNIEPIFDAYKISKQTVKIAKEGIFIGIGLSFIGMIFALFGLLPPFWGAIIQEGIDMTVILYALRAGVVA